METERRHTPAVSQRGELNAEHRLILAQLPFVFSCQAASNQNAALCVTHSESRQVQDLQTLYEVAKTHVSLVPTERPLAVLTTAPPLQPPNTVYFTDWVQIICLCQYWCY